MKNLNQADSKPARRPLVSPSKKRLPHELPPRSLRESSSLAFFPDDPFNGRSDFEVTLDWIGASMQPEVPPGSRAWITKRASMFPAAGEVSLGQLKTGHLIFGALDVMERGLWRIAFINPDFPPIYYPEKHFKWMYPVERVSLFNETEPSYTRLAKKLEFFFD